MLSVAESRQQGFFDSSVEQRAELERWARRPTTAQALALRSRVVLACADGVSNRQVAARLGLHEATVGKWRRRFVERGPGGLLDEPRPGAPRTVSDEKVEEIVRATLEEQPADATHWSTRSMANRAGVSQSTVSRIWRAFALQPHRTDVKALETDLARWTALWNDNPRPYLWMKTADEILINLARYCQRISDSGH